jgi:hypothetical protein
MPRCASARTTGLRSGARPTFARERLVRIDAPQVIDRLLNA